MRIGVDARNLVPNLSGIGRYVLEMCRVLGEQGHSLVLYLPETPRNPLPPLPGCEIRLWNFRGPWQRAVWSMTMLPKAANADVLDVFWGPAHRLPFGLKTRLGTIVTIHDLVWQKAAETMYWQTWMGERLFMRSALRRAHHIVAVSTATAQDVIAFEPSVAERTHVIHSGLTDLPPPDGRVFMPPADDGHEMRYALFVGTLEPRKNLTRLLEAFALLAPPVRAQLKLIIAGGQGWHMGGLSALIAQHHLQDSVILTGYVSDAELAQLYSSAYILLMPSLHEGFGFPIIEAQSFGVPVITSTTSSMPEVAGDGAILVDPRSAVAIAEAITRLASDALLRTTLSKNARANAARFSWKKAGNKLVGLFQKTMGPTT